MDITCDGINVYLDGRCVGTLEDINNSLETLKDAFIQLANVIKEFVKIVCETFREFINELYMCKSLFVYESIYKAKNMAWTLRCYYFIKAKMLKLRRRCKHGRK